MVAPGCRRPPFRGLSDQVDDLERLVAGGAAAGQALVQAHAVGPEADVQVLFDPPWSMGMMSDAAKLQLGMM